MGLLRFLSDTDANRSDCFHRCPFAMFRRRLLLGLTAGVLLLLVPVWGLAEQVLRVLAWPGYADADIVKAFERRTGARVEVTFVDSDLDLWNKVSSTKGQGFDVLAVNTAELQRYIQADLVQPIDATAIPHLARQLPRFRQAQGIPGLVSAGKTWAVPYTYAEMGLIYDRKQWPEPPRTVAALWDERLQGKVIAYSGGTHNFSLAALESGLPSPFRLDDRQWPVLVQRLIDLRRNVGGFYTQPDESVRLFQQHRAALMLANFGSQQVQLLRAAGVDVGYAVPKEGALAWLDCWAVTRGARHPALAMAWIDHLLDVPASQALVQRQGLANTVSESPFLQPGARLVWLEPVEDENRRNRLWSRIVSGARASRVLAP